MNYGILSKDRAIQLYKEMCKRKGIKMSTTETKKRPIKKRKKSNIISEDAEPDMQISGADTIGATVL